jgi:hypothetical protein
MAMTTAHLLEAYLEISKTIRGPHLDLEISILSKYLIQSRDPVPFKIAENKKRGGEHLCWLVPVNRGEEVPGEGEGEAGVPLLHPTLQPQHHWEPTVTRILKELFSSRKVPTYLSRVVEKKTRPN